MSQNDVNQLFQQMGELLSGVRGLHDAIDIRQAQAEQLHELLRSDLATLRRDQRDLEEKLDFFLLTFQGDIEQLRIKSAESDRTLEMVLSTIEKIRLPIHQIIAFNSRIAGSLFVIGILGSCALWLVDPIYKWLMDALLHGR